MRQYQFTVVGGGGGLAPVGFCRPLSDWVLYTEVPSSPLAWREEVPLLDHIGAIGQGRDHLEQWITTGDRLRGITVRSTIS